MAAQIKTDLRGEIAMQRTSTTNVVTHQQQKNFAEQSGKTCVSAIRVNALASAYVRVCEEILEENLTQLTYLVAAPQENVEEFLELERKCNGASVESIIEDSKAELLKLITAGIKELKE